VRGRLSWHLRDPRDFERPPRQRRANPVGATPRDPDPVGVARHRREVAYDEHEVAGVSGASHERHHALLPVGAVDPREPGRVSVEFVEARSRR
jgi:hypothetical protein